MPEYRIYRMTKDGHISGPADIVECADEGEAFQKALQYVDGHDIELWDGGRLLCRLPRTKAP